MGDLAFWMMVGLFGLAALCVVALVVIARWPSKGNEVDSESQAPGFFDPANPLSPNNPLSVNNPFSPTNPLSPTNPTGLFNPTNPNGIYRR